MQDSDSDKVYYDNLKESFRKDGIILTGDPDHDFGEPTEEDLANLQEFFEWYKAMMNEREGAQ